jgi:AGCS family alanine or glycine:cation symporter
VNGVLWHDSVLLLLLLTGVVFTVWTRFAQGVVLTHGFKVIRGVYDDPKDPGAINHFQALSAALSATVGLGNIGGVALAIALGGPGAVFWMWVVGFFGMAIKLTEVSLAMLYRNTQDPENPHGGPMWVASKGMALRHPALAPVGRIVGVIFCLTLLVSTATGGNMFQAWNVGSITQAYFGVPSVVCGIVLAVLVGMVIIGGIKRIGAVAGRLVPIMVTVYLIGGAYVLIMNADQLLDMFKLIFTSAFSTAEASGAFLGGTAGYAFLFGMKRALFSNEAGQGSSPIAHAAAKTDEPVREAIVAGLEPFIDTLVVCTFSALVILSTGIWNRPAEASYAAPPELFAVGDGHWTASDAPAPARQGSAWLDGDRVFMVVTADANAQSGNRLNRLEGRVVVQGDQALIDWGEIASGTPPSIKDPGIYVTYVGATLTAKAFDSVNPGLGKWLITAAVWLFAVSTMISWSYYGEQGVIFLFGERAVLPYKVVYCALIILATWGFIETDADLDNLTGVGTGVMLFANVPIMWLFARQAMLAYSNYHERLRTGRMGPDHPAPSLEDLISGRDVSGR